MATQETTSSTHAGATALHALITKIGAISDETCEIGRDFQAMAAALQTGLENNMHHQDPGHREGFLRALTSMFCLWADGCGQHDNWDPLSETEAAFAACAAQGEST